MCNQIFHKLTVIMIKNYSDLSVCRALAAHEKLLNFHFIITLRKKQRFFVHSNGFFILCLPFNKLINSYHGFMPSYKFFIELILLCDFSEQKMIDCYLLLWWACSHQLFFYKLIKYYKVTLYTKVILLNKFITVLKTYKSLF